MVGYENDLIGKAKKMHIAYKNIRKQKQVSKLDRRLIELLDDNLKNIFEVFFIIDMNVSLNYLFRKIFSTQSMRKKKKMVIDERC